MIKKRGKPNKGQTSREEIASTSQVTRKMLLALDATSKDISRVNVQILKRT